MTTYDKDEFPKPLCPMGYPWEQIADALAEDVFKEFSRWMGGQTMMICDGRRYNYEAKAYEPDECAGGPHGGVVYTYDLHRFLGFLGHYHQQLWD